MTSLYLWGGGSLLVLVLIWLYARSQAALGSAETEAEHEKEAREAENEMADEMMQPMTPEQVRRKLDEGTF